LGLGDEIMAAGCAQRAFAADPSKRVAICDAAGTPRWHDLWEGNPIIAPPAAVRAGEPVTRIINAAGARPYVQSFSREEGWKFTPGWRARDQVGRLYLTHQERTIGLQLRERGPYVLLEPSLKGVQTRNKAWGFGKWLGLVKACPEVKFVRVLHEDRRTLPIAHQFPDLGFRQVLGLLASASAYVGPEGGLHHAAAALGVRAVVVFGGCIDPAVMGYPTHVNVADIEPGSPCGRYAPCTHCAEAMRRISVQQVTDALRDVLTQ
jgi:hypothetical protein